MAPVDPGSVSHRYLLIVLIALCGSLQIALNFRLKSTYFLENEHIIKSTLAVPCSHSR